MSAASDRFLFASSPAVPGRMGDVVSWAIRFIHIMSGVLWVGGAFLWGMVIAPRIMQKGPPAIRRPFLEAALKPISNFLMIGGVVTILSGIVLMGMLVGWSNLLATFQGTHGPPGYGIALGIGFVAALIMVIEGVFIIKPTAFKLLAAMQAMPAPAPGAPPAPPPPEIPALGKKLGIASMTTILLGTIALAAMAWAVNVFR